jgi:hypothetical protein
MIKRWGGEIFSNIFRKSTPSKFEVEGMTTQATMQDILDAVRESRERLAGRDDRD